MNMMEMAFGEVACEQVDCGKSTKLKGFYSKPQIGSHDQGISARNCHVLECSEYIFVFILSFGITLTNSWWVKEHQVGREPQ